MEIDRARWVGQTEAIVLSEHVDYWNRLGWVDPFSSTRFSDRQKAYAAHFTQAGIYTPQMVIDGRAECVGSDRANALRAISDAGRSPKASVTLTLVPGRSPKAGDPIGLTVRVAEVPGGPVKESMDVFLAVTENRLRSQVLRGENSGHRLEHTGVVRRLTVLGVFNPGRTAFTVAAEVNLESGWNRDNLRVVVFVQERRSGRIMGAASLPLAKGPLLGTPASAA
jgi:hypothetical protein